MIHFTSSREQGGGGSFKNRKPIGRVCCFDSRMAERIGVITMVAVATSPQLLDVVGGCAVVVVVVGVVVVVVQCSCSCKL